MDFSNIELWERAYIDLWSIPHFMFGFAGFYFLQKIGFKSNQAFIVIVVAIIWEFLEVFIKIEEALTNRFTDVVLTILSLFILMILNKKHFKKENILFKYSLSIFIGVSIIGWTAFLFRIFN